MNRPWLLLSPYTRDDKWWLGYRNDRHPEKHPRFNKFPQEENIICYYVIQDCNSMGGKYYRVFTWYKNNDVRYLTVEGSLNFMQNLPDYTKDLIEIKEGEIYENKSGNKFRVIDCKFSEFDSRKYVKIFELVSLSNEKKQYKHFSNITIFFILMSILYFCYYVILLKENNVI